MQREIQEENRKKMQKPPTNLNLPTPCPDCGRVFTSAKVMKIHWAKIHYNDKVKKRSDKSQQQNGTAKTNIAVSII